MVRLRKVDGAFNFIRSDVACLQAGGVVRARSVLKHRALPVDLAFGHWLLAFGRVWLLFGFLFLVWHRRPRRCLCFG